MPLRLHARVSDASQLNGTCKRIVKHAGAVSVIPCLVHQRDCVLGQNVPQRKREGITGMRVHESEQHVLRTAF